MAMSFLHNLVTAISIAQGLYLELLSGRVQWVLYEIGVVTAPLQQHEDVLQFQVDLGVQGHLHVHNRGGAEEDRDRQRVSELPQQRSHVQLSTASL